MAFFGKKNKDKVIKYPGIRQLADGRSAVILCERESTDAAGIYLSTPNSEMATLWNIEKEKGHLNISNRPLISVVPEDNCAASTATAGLSLSGLRATHFSSSAQSISSIHESLSVAVGKRLPFILNMTCKATTKATSNIYCSHDDYHSIDDTGVIQFFARNNQAAADLNIIGRKIAELSLNPVAIAQDGFLTSHLIEPINLPERELIQEFVGLPDDIISTPTPAQRMLYGKSRRRVPEVWSVDQPVQSGGTQNTDSYMQTVAGQRPYFFDHVTDIAEQCMDEWFELTGRRYRRIHQYHCKNADYLIITQGSVSASVEATIDYLQTQQKIKIGLVDITLFRPFPGDLLSQLLKGKKGVLVLERTDQPLSVDLPIIADIRASISKSIENANNKKTAFEGYASYGKTSDIAPLYSACFGLGGHEIAPKDIIAAVENMLSSGQQKKFVYLGIHFTHPNTSSPQQDIQQHDLLEAYPNIHYFSLPSSEPPRLLPESAFTVYLHSTGRRDIANIGLSLAQTLFTQFNFAVKASVDFSSEKDTHASNFLITTVPEPLRLNFMGSSVNAVISTDLGTFSQDNPLSKLVDHGVLIIQSALSESKTVWDAFPRFVQQDIISKQIKVFYVDAVQVAQQAYENSEHESRTELELQQIVLKSVFFKVSGIIRESEKKEDEVQSFIDDNLEIVKSSYALVQEIKSAEMQWDESEPSHHDKPSTPLLLVQKPANDNAIASIHRFWNQTGHAYREKNGNTNLADPYTALGIVPASTSIFGDMTASRVQHPQWIAENCTACGNCYNACPDSAIPGLINTVNEAFETNIKRIEKTGHVVKHLRRAIRTVEKKYHQLTVDKSVGTNLDPIFAKAIGDTIKEYPEIERDEVTQEFKWFNETIGSFKFALTEPYHDEMNDRMPRNGGLFSITINPNSCKGCMECVEVCETEALSVVKQTDKSVHTLRENWNYWLDLPTSNKKYNRIDDLQAKKGALNTLLLDKKNHNSMFNGDNTGAGSGEKIAIHLFTSTVTALMQPRVEQHIKYINQLITDMEKRIRLQLVATLDISDIDALETAIDENQNVDLTLSRLSCSLDKDRATQPIDPAWLKWALQIVAKLKHLKWSYKQGESGEGRASLGITESCLIASSKTATYPYNPYPFPWAKHLSSDATALAMGLFEGHMVKMAEGFKAIRTAELEIKGQYDKDEHDKFFAYFDWHQFSEEEHLLCPPLVSLGADSTSFDSGFQSLSHSLLSGTPIKVLVLDNHPPHDPASAHKELTLIAMAHRTTYVHQSSISNTQHLLEGYIDGLNFRGPALWNIYASTKQENNLANKSLLFQSKLAVESRAYPLISFDPNGGKTWEECISIAGNIDIDQDWIIYTLNYTDEYGNKFSMDVPLTYADWALTEVRYASHFKPMAADADSDDSVLLTDYLAMDSNEQADNIPFIWAVHPQTNHLLKVVVSKTMVKATNDRKDFWHTLKGLSGKNRVEVDTQAIADQAKAEMAQTITEGLMSMVGGDAGALTRILADVPAITAKASSTVETKLESSIKKEVEKPPEAKPAEKKAPSEKKSDAQSAHEPVWIETPDCTTCDECVDIAPAMFKYDDDKKAIVIDPTAGTFEQIVRSAEKCTAVIIHPGTPWNPDEPNLEKLIKRAEKFQ